MNFDRVRPAWRGVLFNLLKQPERALQAYRDSHRADPGHAGTLRMLGWMEAQREHWADAVGWFEKAVAIEPDRSPAKRSSSPATPSRRFAGFPSPTLPPAANPVP